MGFDIVEVMREKAAHTRNIAGDYWGDWMCNVAADDIERLRALLAEAERAVVYMCSDGAATWLSLRDRIAAALWGGKK